MSKHATNIVHIVDDDQALRDSLAVLLRVRGVEATTYDRAETFLAALPSIQGGCALLDVNMPGMSGLELLGKIRSEGSSIPCIVMTGFGEISIAVKAMKAGAVDFLEKPFEDDILFESVLHALKKQIPADPTIDNRIVRLTRREREVMQGIARGDQNKVIAKDLGISPRTVEIHRARVMTKLEVSSVADIVKISLSSGLKAL
jgi:two-component system, LuxR family, response regulator FixJ